MAMQRNYSLGQTHINIDTSCLSLAINLNGLSPEQAEETCKER